MVDLKERIKMSRHIKDNKGFSLVELIIVIAIMAILVGVVGMQVIPYLEKSRQSKDMQIINGICTSTMTTYAECAADLDASSHYALRYSSSGLGDVPGSPDATPTSVINNLIDLTGYHNLDEIKASMSSKASHDITHIDMEFDSTRAIAIVTVGLTPGSRYGSVFTPISVK